MSYQAVTWLPSEELCQPCTLPLVVAIRALSGDFRVAELLPSHVHAHSEREKMIRTVFDIFLLLSIMIQTPDTQQYAYILFFDHLQPTFTIH